MKVAIHQPEHFPYEGFFQKLKLADIFVILDDVKFCKNNFQNRNKIKLLSGEEQWITVPVEKKATRKIIKDVTVSADVIWRKKINQTIFQNLKTDISDIYMYDKLVDINMSSIKWCMGRMGIETPIVMASELNVEGNKSKLLANIVKAVDGRMYISGPGGRNYLDLKYFEGIKVRYFEPIVQNYYSMLYNICK